MTEKPEGTTVTNLAEAKLKKAKRRTGAPPDDPNDDRPTITLNRGRRPEILNQADKALGTRDATVFEHSGRLVRLTEPPAQIDATLYPASTLLHEVTVANMCERLARVARFEQFDARANRDLPADVPRDVACGLLERSGEWRHIRRLRGFVEAPTLRDDGSVLSEQGYDAQSGLFMIGASPPGFSMPQETRAAALKALDFIQHAFFTLPFSSAADCYAAVTALLTALVRRVLPSAPLIGITAPSPGTGKSLFADAIAIIATGRRAPVLSFGRDDIEAEKRLIMKLLGGDAMIVIDNLERPLYGDMLCSILTQPAASLRPLGSGKEHLIATNITLMVTANNLDIRGDLRRRVLLVSMDAGVERPELVHFAKELLAEISAQRGELVRAALTIIRAYLASDRQGVNIPPFGSFERWSLWCRQPLVWLGGEDPLLASQSLREQDPDLAIQRQFFSTWVERFGAEAVTSAVLCKSSQDSDAGELKVALTVQAHRFTRSAAEKIKAAGGTVEILTR